MYGMFAIQEAVRQLRGRGFFSAAGSLVLANRLP
jgi:hypothetical protein